MERIVETPQTPMQPAFATCQVCGDESHAPVATFGTGAWHRWWPSCRHGEFFTCPKPECNEGVRCKVCGGSDFYT